MKFKYFKLVLLILICGLCMVNCQKEAPEKEERFPVKYSLKKNVQDWFKHLVIDDSLVFISGSSDTLYMKSDGLFEDLFFSLNESFQGQKLSTYYTCQSDYLKTFKIGYQLQAMNDSSARLMLVNISGLLISNPKSANYTFSTASFNLHSVKDTFSIETSDCRLLISDSVQLKTGTFKPSYFVDSSQSINHGSLTQHLYFNPNLGFIGFKTKDGKEWARIHTK